MPIINAGPTPSSHKPGCSLFTRLGGLRDTPDEETTNWRAVCGKTARTVRRAGRGNPSRPLSAFGGRILPPHAVRILTAAEAVCRPFTARARTVSGAKIPLNHQKFARHFKGYF